MPSDDALLTVEEVAALLEMSPATVRRKCAGGDLPARKVGRNWLIDGDSLPRLTRRTTRRRPRTASGIVDFPVTLRHLRSQDLRYDLWVPDVLRHEDDLANIDTVVAAAAARIDRDEHFDPPVIVPVPKSSFFPRNAVNLSITDRVAYHAVVESFSALLESELTDCVYSAHLSSRKGFFLANGRDSWLAWRRSVIEDIESGNEWLIETDVTSYFDFIKHEILILELEDLGVDHLLIPPLREMLRTWTTTPNTGIPQGPDASRVLANFYMTPVDHVMQTLTGVNYFRYMDDIRITGARRSAVLRALRRLDNECRRRGLALSTRKTELHHGPEALRSLAESDLDAAQYAFDSSLDNDDDLRKMLRGLFRKAIARDGTVKSTRWARFSLARLFQLRDRAVLIRVLDSLENLAPLGELIPKYIHPWIRNPRIQNRLTEFLNDPERNTSEFLSTWLLAVMLDVPDDIPDSWVDYARMISLDPSEPSFHRSLAINVLVLGLHTRDIASVEDLIHREYDPEIVRASLVALARIGKLTRRVHTRASRIRGIDSTLTYLKGRDDLPSLIFATRRNRAP